MKLPLLDSDMARHAIDLLERALLAPADPDDVDSVDTELIEAVCPLIVAFSRTYFRQEVQGIDDVPDGKTLIVGNHNAGITWLEPFGMGASYYLERGTDQIIHGLAHDAMMAPPLLGNLLSHLGGLRASQENSRRAFERDRKIFVSPGGNHEAFRPYRDRYKIDLANRTGFIRLALNCGVSITPVVFVGGHETFFVIRSGRRIARRMGIDKRFRFTTWPLMVGLPWGVFFGPMFHLPLPAKSVVRFLEPVDLSGYSPDDANEPAALKEIYRDVTGRMQRAMDEISSKRRFPVLG